MENAVIWNLLNVEYFKAHFWALSPNINDRDLVSCKYKSFSTLYADDLGTFFYFQIIGNTAATINWYLKKLMKWPSKWRLIMNT